MSVLGCCVWMACLGVGPEGGGEPMKPVKVEVRKEGQAFRLHRAGKPYYIRGAVYWADPAGRFPLKDLLARGGNSVRCGGGNVRKILDEAARLGATATVGLRMKMEAVHKFDYDDPAAVRKQLEEMRSTVMELKDHPALLMWGIGNELSMGYTNRKVWDAVDEAARMIHEIDGLHPTMTTIGGGSVGRGDIREIRTRCGHLDLLGINYYMHIETVPDRVRKDGWDRHYVITEWGPSGDWQVSKTKWKAAIEETSTLKAQRYVERYQATMARDTDLCLGSYVFMWQPRMERTHTWYGMLLETGERTEAVNAMQYLWTGTWPANRAPKVGDLRIDGRIAADNVYVEPGSEHKASIEAVDPEGDELTYRWEVMAEVARAGYAGMGERPSKLLADVIRQSRGAELTFAAPSQEGAYRVFVFVLDGQGNAGTANIPFYVRGR